MRRRFASPALVLVALAIGLAATLVPSVAAGGAGANVYVVDNAFVRVVQRPVVRIKLNRTVTWRWRSRQSHSVSVRSGPERFATETRNRGTFTRRFSKAGTYRFECSLHAPGMKMTVVVSR
jgi:plastocyanin